MCLLVYMKEDVTPDMDNLLEASYQNNDGFGFAIHAGNSIVTGQDMDYDRLANKFLEARNLNKGQALFHLRIATHGTTNKGNCHPFFLGGDRNTVVAHNGIMDVKIPKNDNRSDTKVFAEDIMPGIGGIVALDNKKYFERLQTWAKGNRLVFLTTNDDAKSDSYIINEDEGHWIDGVWYSNYGYQPYNGYSWKRDENWWNDSEYEYDYGNHQPYTKQRTASLLGSPNQTVRFVYEDGYAIQDGDWRTHYSKLGKELCRVYEPYKPEHPTNLAKWSNELQKLIYPTSTMLIPAFKQGAVTTYSGTGKTVKEGNQTTHYNPAGQVLWVEHDRERLKLSAVPDIAPIGTPRDYDDEREIFDEHDTLSTELQELFDFVIPFDKPADGFMAICCTCGAGKNIEKEYLLYTTHCEKCDACYHCRSKTGCDCWDELIEEAW